MKTVIKSMLIAALIPAMLVSAALFVLFSFDAVDEGVYIPGVFLIAVVGGAFVGFFIGIVKAKSSANVRRAMQNAEKLQQEAKMREAQIRQLKSMAHQTAALCGQYIKELPPVAKETYIADRKMENIVNELSNAYEFKGLIDHFAEDVKRGRRP